MARGAEAKTKISEMILNSFEGSFIAADGKTLRIPYNENGERIEVKVSLVAAKDCERGGDSIPADNSTEETVEAVISEPTQDELDKVNNLLNALNL